MTPCAFTLEDVEQMLILRGDRTRIDFIDPDENSVEATKAILMLVKIEIDDCEHSYRQLVVDNYRAKCKVLPVGTIIYLFQRLAAELPYYFAKFAAIKAAQIEI